MVSGLKGFSTVKAGSGGNEKKSIPDGIDQVKWKEHDKKKLRVRLVGPVVPYVIHWVDITTKNKGIVPLPKVCCNYNPSTDEWESEKGCPWCNAQAKAQRRYMVNAIIREEQDKEPKSVSRNKRESKKKILADGYEAYVKDPDSTSWTPVKTLVLSGGVAKQLKDLTEANLDKKDRVRELSDPKYGMDLTIKYDSSETGTGMFRVDSVKRTPLTEEEQDYLVYNLFEAVEIPSLKDAKAEYEELESRGLLVGSDDDEEDEEAEDLDDDDDDDSDSDEDDDEDEKPAKKKKSKKGKKSKKDKKKKKSRSLDDF